MTTETYLTDSAVTAPGVRYDAGPYGNGRFFADPRPRAGVNPRGSLSAKTLAILATWALVTACLAIWVHGVGGGRGLLDTFRSGGPAIVTALGGLAGWIAALIFLFNLLLMARIPFFEFGFGRDHIVFWHRKLGFWSFWFLIAHILLKSLGWAGRPGMASNFIAQIGRFITGWHGMIMATIATCLILLAVMLVSLSRVRNTMKYETWHLLHLLAYPAVFLALPHMFGTGTALATNTWARRFWWALWICTALALLLWRFILPYIRSNRHDVRVEEVVPDGSRGVTVKMRGRDLDQLRARGGSFFTFRFIDGPNSYRGHPFSLSMPPTDDRLQIAVRVVGDGTERIANLKPGTRVLLEGPMGRINGDLRLGNRLMMFGAGAGVGPMVAILGEQDWAPGEAILVTRDNVPEETMMIPEITDLVQRRGLIWHRIVGGIPTSGSTWLGADANGVAPDGAAVLQQWLLDDPAHPGLNSGREYTNTDIYMCGPPPWMKALKRDVIRAGINPDQIHIEEFAY